MKIRHLVDTPTVWMSMNPQYRDGYVTKYDFQKAIVEGIYIYILTYIIVCKYQSIVTFINN